MKSTKAIEAISKFDKKVIGPRSCSFGLELSLLQSIKTRFMNFQFLRVLLASIMLLLNYSFSLAQSAAPPYRTPGTPTGSYKLDGFDNVNLFSGNLNFNLPLVTNAGRGEVPASVGFTLETQWKVSGSENAGIYLAEFSPISPNVLSIVGSFYGEGESTADMSSPCGNEEDGAYTHNHRFFYVYTEPDGTQHTLVDRIYKGAVVNSCGMDNVNRGRIFESHDGSFITFVADVDQPGASASGYLYFPNGSKARVGTDIEWIKDRNGNTLTFTRQPNGLLTKVTDSNGREINFEYGVNDVAPYGLCDRVKFKGTNGADRYIRIKRELLSTRLRTTQPGDSTTVKTMGQLFGDIPNDNVSVYGGNIPHDPNVFSKLWLPDGRSYQFKYNVYGQLARVELPTGGAVEYDFTVPGAATWGIQIVENRVTAKRYYDHNNALVRKTTFTKTANSTDVEDFDPTGARLAKQKHYFHGDPYTSEGVTGYGFTTPYWHGKEYKTETYDTNGTTLLRVTEMTWQQKVPNWCSLQYSIAIQLCGSNPPNTIRSNNPVIAEVKQTLSDGNLVNKVTSINPANGTLAFDSFNNKTDEWVYDFGTGAPGAFKHRKHTDYVTDPNYTDYTGSHLRNLPTQTWISSDVNGASIVSRTQIEYDNYVSDARHAPLMPRSSVYGHDTASYGTGFIRRGNPTQTVSYADAAGQTGAVFSSIQYDILGNPVKTIDQNGNISTISYLDNFGAPNAEARTNSAPAQLNGQQTFAFPTSAINPKGWVTYAQFDYFTGAGVDAEDINGNVSSVFYNDLLDRPTQSISANNTAQRSQTTIVYDDANRRIQTTSDLFNFGDNLNKSEAFYDGLGRTTQGRKYETGGGYIATLNEYDGLGRVKRVSNPYRPLAGEALLWTTSNYDSLSRPVSVVTPDGATVQTAYSGNAVTVTDQAGKQRRSVSNGLGQLIRVDEPDDSGNLGAVSSPVQPTSYTYDILGNLAQVNQGVQVRTFQYNSLSQLKVATNPESGTIQYNYDNGGNLTQKTDARGVVANYTYDAISRVLTRTYSDGTPAVTYTYDDPAIQFSKGRLTKVSSSVSETRYSIFDNLGRVLSSQQLTDGQTYTFGYAYNLSGALVSEVYPSGRTVTNQYRTDGMLAQTNGSFSGVNKTYVGNFTYTSAGAASSLQLGNGRWENTVFNNRLQPTQLGLGTAANAQDLWKVNYDYGIADNNGNIKSQTITVPGINPLVQTYTYDSLNRIKSATENNGAQTWKQTFVYDRYGNRRFDAANTTTLGSCPANQCNPTIDAANNKFTTGQGYSYDLAGNVVTDAQGRTFYFDGENKQKEVRNSSNQIIGQYIYNGDGKRVKKISANDTTIFVYDAFGAEKAEYRITTSAPQAPMTNYLTNDTLGSPRIITDQTGAVVSRKDFRPYGEEIPRATYGQDSVRQKFTGYERDIESDLDFAQARMYSNKLGRFNSADNFVNDTQVLDTASWNLYVYARNNPFYLVDPNGEKVYVGNVTGDDRDELLRRINYTYGCEACVAVDDDGYLTVDTQGLDQDVIDATQFLTDAITADAATILFSVEIANNSADVAFGDSGAGRAAVNVRTADGRTIRTSAIRIRLDFGDDTHVTGDAQTREAYLNTVFAHEVRHFAPRFTNDPQGNDANRSRGEVVNSINEILRARGLPLRERYAGTPNRAIPNRIELYHGSARTDRQGQIVRGRDGIEVRTERDRTIFWSRTNVGGSGIN